MLISFDFEIHLYVKYLPAFNAAISLTGLQLRDTISAIFKSMRSKYQMLL